jgi:predicted DsbA family dithiol-disulfide isomerase
LKTVRIDFVSDIACPWCAIGLASLQKAIDQVGSEVKTEISFQPYELNPQMPVGGRDVFEYLTEKYSRTLAEVQASQENIYRRAADVGFAFHPEGRKRVYNTFNAHRLLHWAKEEHGAEAQLRLKKELFHTYFTLAINFDDQQNILDAVARAELPTKRAQEILNSDELSQTVRDQEQKYMQLGINSVPAIIFNNQYLVQGGQAPEVFAKALLEYSQ